MNENGRKRNNLNESDECITRRTISIWNPNIQMYNKHDTQFNSQDDVVESGTLCELRISNDVGIQRPTNETTINEQIIIS